MKKITVAFIIIFGIALLFSACGGQDGIVEPEALEYDIVIDETVDIYIWEDVLQIEPKLMDNHGRIVPSRFDYHTTSSDIEISYDGRITIKNVPKEPVSVTLFEKNTSTEKTVELNFVSDFTTVKAITSLDGARVEKLEGLTLTQDVVLSVVSDQRNIKIRDFMLIKVTDKNGNEKNVFEITFDKSNITLKPIGIGEGEIYLEIVNGAGKKLYSSTVPFSISMKDKALSDTILSREKKSLISCEELDKVDDIVVSSSVKSLAETKYMTSLETVIIEGNQLLVFDGSPDSCFYRVKDTLYKTYYENSAYSNVKERIVPYKNSYDERYAVYHSAKGEPFDFGLVGSGMKFPTNTSPGYTNVGWENEKGRVTEAQVNGMNKPIVHLNAVWEANENQLIFDGNGCTSGQMKSQIIRSDASANIVKNGFKKAGYTFKGWSTVANGGVAYNDEAVYNMGLNASYTLYAVWEANINTLKFNANGGEGKMSELRIATDAQSALSKNLFQRKGYDFVGWTDKKDGEAIYKDGSVYKMGVEQSYEIFAVWKPIEYTVTYKLDGGTAGSYSPAKYTIESHTFKLSYPTRTNYEFLGWIGEGIKEPQTDVSITPSADNLKNLEYTAVWGARVILLPNGANGDPAEQVVRTNTTIEKLSKNTFQRAGYFFLGWSTAPNGEVEYEDESEYKCGGDAMYYLYAVWHEGTPGLKYTGTDHYSVSGYSGTHTDIIIPAKYNGISVTGIAKSVFKYNTKITSFEMPMGLINYEAGLLAGCSSITSMKIVPLGGMTLGSFFGTSSYKGSVGVTQTTGNSQKTYYIPENLRSVTITGYQVADGFFENCKNLANVVLEQGFTKIGANAFKNCTNLRTVIIPEGVKEIGDYAFAGCTHLETIMLPKSLEKIGKNAFEGCSSLNNVVLHGESVDISDYAFADCGKLSFFFVSENIEHIGKYAFKNCVGLSEFTFPSIVVAVDEHAFDGCTGLKSITVKGNTKFAENAFSGCTSLASVKISDQVTEFDTAVFTSLKNNVFTAYNGALYVGSAGNPYKILVGVVDKSIEKCVIANGTNMINTGAFSGCNKLKEITIPASVYVIKANAFEACTALKAVHITNLDAWCRIQFVNNSNTTNAIMNPLYYAHSLYLNGNAVTHVTIPSGLIRVNGYVFQGCTTLESVALPASVQTIGESAFMGCSNLKEVNIPQKVTIIGEYAFADSGLTEAAFENSSAWYVLKSGSSKKVEWASVNEAAKLLSKDYATYKWYK